mmetsp:Transcript_7238/g.11413  ORF Transcript_7238/g.11413 Transcript_7238/m.11413 type:complete len:107 (+) Transcript_7238:188-508(+)
MKAQKNPKGNGCSSLQDLALDALRRHSGDMRSRIALEKEAKLEIAKEDAEARTHARREELLRQLKELDEEVENFINVATAEAEQEAEEALEGLQAIESQALAVWDV